MIALFMLFGLVQGFAAAPSMLHLQLWAERLTMRAPGGDPHPVWSGITWLALLIVWGIVFFAVPPLILHHLLAPWLPHAGDVDLGDVWIAALLIGMLSYSMWYRFGVGKRRSRGRRRSPRFLA
jgi:hypothetical protein